MTRSSPQTSSPPAPPRPDAPARGRKRFEVFFASRTGAPRGIAASEARRRSTALRWRAHESSRPVEVVTRPRYLVGPANLQRFSASAEPADPRHLDGALAPVRPLGQQPEAGH